MKKIRLLLTQNQYKNVINSIMTAMHDELSYETNVKAHRQAAVYKRLLKLITAQFNSQTKVLNKSEVSIGISCVQHRKKL